MTSATTATPIDLTVTGTLTVIGEIGGWTVLPLPDSATDLGTRKTVKVAGTIDGHPFAATLMPSGAGPHWLPVKAALRKAIGKAGGAEVTVHLTERFG